MEDSKAEKLKITRTIKLELVRSGPAHNQLLSPLTPYMALCGDHPTETINIPFEQRDYLVNLRALRYQDNSLAQRQQQLSPLSRDVGKILGEIPGLAAELGGEPRVDGELVHLSLVYSAAELALLPFEMALSPAGCPGSGEPLTLQFSMPLTLTRETRAGHGRQVKWPSQPKILFIVSNAGGEVPLDAHLAALSQAVAPWVAKPFSQNAKSILRIVNNASLESIAKMVKENSFTHVHVLAHGGQIDEGGEPQFGLVLHADTNRGVARVSASQFACALLGHRDGASGGMSRPAVITLTACDSAGQGSVINPSSSFAHYLHAAGVPFVVGSQYPLTEDGSVIVAATLYEGLLWGEDPRVVLHDIRLKLAQNTMGTHDWASLVAYGSLPNDLEDQLEDIRDARANEARAVAVHQAENATVKPNSSCTGTGTGTGNAIVMSAGISSGTGPVASTLAPLDDPFDAALDAIDRANARSDVTLNQKKDQKASAEVHKRQENLRIQGDAQVRKAQLCFLDAIKSRSNAERVKSLQKKELPALDSAARSYEAAYEMNPCSYWFRIQALAVNSALHSALVPRQWDEMRLVAQAALLRGEEAAGSAQECLLNLQLIAVNNEQLPDRAMPEAETLGWVDAMCVPPLNFPRLHNVMWQLWRFATWWRQDESGPIAATVAARMLTKLPKSCPQLQNGLDLLKSFTRKLESPVVRPLEPGKKAKGGIPKGVMAMSASSAANAISASSPDDPNKGKFSGKSESATRTLSAKIEIIRGGWCSIDLTVQSTNNQPLTGLITFYLHPTYQSPIKVEPENGKATLNLKGFGAFTVGVVADNGDRLELDLSDPSKRSPADRAPFTGIESIVVRATSLHLRRYRLEARTTIRMSLISLHSPAKIGTNRLRRA